MSTPKKIKFWHIAIILLFLAVATYYSVLDNEFMLDDNNFIRGKYLQTFSNFGDYFTKTIAQHYYPFYYLINIEIFKHFQDDLITLHSINVFLFLVSCILFFAVSNRISKRLDASLIACILFCLHPLNAFTVNYITANFIFVNAICLLLSFLSFISAFENTKKRFIHLSLSLLFFIGGLLSFEGAIFFPVCLWAWLYFHQQQDIRKSFYHVVPYCFLSVIYFILWSFMTATEISLLDKITFHDMNFISYVALLTKILAWYVSRLIVPENIVFIKSFLPTEINVWGWLLFFLLSVASLVILVAKKWKKSLNTFLLAWFASGFVLVFIASFAHVYMGLVFEPHWVYFASMGLFLLAGIGIANLKQVICRPLWWAFLIIISLYLYSETQRYNRLAQTEKSYCHYWLNITPGNPIAMMSLAQVSASENKAMPRGKRERKLRLRSSADRQ